jgi:hypothetical protein
VDPLLDYFAVVDDKYDVTVHDAGETVGNGDGGPVLRQTVEGLLDQLFVVFVQGTGGLIQQENRRVFEECPCNGYPLFLPS